MKEYDVIHVNSTYDKGGAGVIAKNIHKSLLKMGLNSHYIFGYNGTGHSHFDEFSTKLSNAYAIKFNSYFYRFATSVFFGRNKYLKVVEYIKNSKIAHLHNIHGFFIDEIKLLDSIPFDTKIIWTMHDEWLLTGRCAVTYGCSEYMKKCNYCPHTGFYPASIKKNYQERYLKKIHFLENHKSLNVVVQSDYLKDKLMNSPMGEYIEGRVIVIPNGIDRFDYSRSTEIITKYKLKPGYMLFVSDYLSNSKGFDRFIEISRKMPNIEFVAVGKLSGKNISIPKNLTILGKIPNSDVRNLYYHADLFAFLSRHDNYPTTILEAQDAGCPIVAMNTGAVGSMLKDYDDSLVLSDFDVEKVESFIREHAGHHKSKRTSKLKDSNTTESMIHSYIELYEKVSDK